MRRPKTALLVTILALGAAGACAVTLVPRLRDAMIGRVARLAVVVTEARASTMAVPTEVDTTVPALVQEDPAEPAPAAKPKAPPPPPVGAIDIPEDRVARLTEKQLRSLRPANVVGPDGSASGVRLHGVGALGVGLADGDVVTSIDGRPITDVSTGMDATLRAWASGEAAAHATVRRAGRTLLVTVHIPKHAALGLGLKRSARGRNDD